MWWHPGAHTRVENVERTWYGMQTSTPSTASTSRWMLAKFAIIAPSSGTPVSCCTVVAASFAPPYAKAALILFLPPFQLPAAGTSTKLSRGIEMIVALVRLREMWTSMIVSDRWPIGLLPPGSVARESEPSSSRLSGPDFQFSARCCTSAPAMGVSGSMSARLTLSAYRL